MFLKPNYRHSGNDRAKSLNTRMDWFLTVSLTNTSLFLKKAEMSLKRRYFSKSKQEIDSYNFKTPDLLIILILLKTL
ncbi:hypothetical protein [uncultured Bartonella sp.]|uniref:hypothetical protein n=1 Tax=uncultured Bartonella sp. TaxID=104108 RepID=UPI0026211CE2|nr:hypothetical protein [uncultured Bartonella sp.]